MVFLVKLHTDFFFPLMPMLSCAPWPLETNYKVFLRGRDLTKRKALKWRKVFILIKLALFWHVRNLPNKEVKKEWGMRDLKWMSVIFQWSHCSWGRFMNEFWWRVGLSLSLCLYFLVAERSNPCSDPIQLWHYQY